MKTLLYFLAITSIILCQNPAPKPMPSIDVQRLNGTWYVGLVFNNTFNSSNPLGISCWTWNLTITDDGSDVGVVENYIDNGNQMSSIINFTVSSQGSSYWVDPYNNTLVWVDMDIRDYTWGCLAGYTSQYAYLFFRSPNYNQNLAHDEITLLAWEDYDISTENSYFINTTNCTAFQLSNA